MNISSSNTKPSSHMSRGVGLLSKIVKPVHAMIVATGVFVSPSLAETPTSSAPEKLVQAEKMNRALMDDLDAKNKVLNDMWSQLKDSPGVPSQKEAFDQWGEFTPQFLTWIQSLPQTSKEQDDFIKFYKFELEKTQQLSQNSTAWKMHAVYLALLGILILYAAGVRLRLGVSEEAKDSAKSAYQELSQNFKKYIEKIHRSEDSFHWTLADSGTTMSSPPLIDEADKAIATPTNPDEPGNISLSLSGDATSDPLPIHPDITGGATQLIRIDPLPDLTFMSVEELGKLLDTIQRLRTDSTDPEQQKILEHQWSTVSNLISKKLEARKEQ